jgi:DNA-binding IclR family transcriptional regulator
VTRSVRHDGCHPSFNPSAVAKRAYAISDKELELGMRALAVSVIDETNEIIAAISVSAASARVAFFASAFVKILLAPFDES